MTDLGLVLVSHSPHIAQGLADLLGQVAQDVDITYTGGDEADGIGSDFYRVQRAVEGNSKSTLLAFYDLGSARMNLELASDFSDKELLIQQVPLIEGAYTAAALLQTGADLIAVQAQLDELEIRK